MPKNISSEQIEHFKKEKSVFKINCNEQDYAKIKMAIEKAEVYNNPFCFVSDESILFDDHNKKIYLAHSLSEFKAYFPDANDIVRQNTYHKNLTEDNILKSMEDENSNETSVDILPLLWKRIALIEKATGFFSSFRQSTLSPNINLTPNSYSANPDKVMLSLIDANDGLILGEGLHSDRAGKKILFDNMKYLSDQGVQTIYFEHIFGDTMSEAILHYFSPQVEPSDIPMSLFNYLRHQDSGNDLVSYNINLTQYPAYTFLGVFMQAKKYNIRIVPIDSSVTYVLKVSQDETENHRCLLMNYNAHQVIAENQRTNPGKYIVFCGNKHSNSKISGVLGLTELTGLPTLCVHGCRNKQDKAVLVFTHAITLPDVWINYDDSVMSQEAQLFTLNKQAWSQKKAVAESSEHSKTVPLIFGKKYLTCLNKLREPDRKHFFYYHTRNDAIKMNLQDNQYIIRPSERDDDKLTVSTCIKGQMHHCYYEDWLDTSHAVPTDSFNNQLNISVDLENNNNNNNNNNSSLVSNSVFKNSKAKKVYALTSYDLSTSGILVDQIHNNTEDHIKKQLEGAAEHSYLVRSSIKSPNSLFLVMVIGNEIVSFEVNKESYNAKSKMINNPAVESQIKEKINQNTSPKMHKACNEQEN